VTKSTLRLAPLLFVFALPISSCSSGTSTGSSGPESVRLPNVVGMSQSAAESTLNDADIRAEFVPSATDQRCCLVTAEEPSAYSGVNAATVVTLSVTGISPPAPVPNVVGHPQAQALQMLQANGYEAIPLQGSGTGVPAGSVVIQKPPAGTQASPGSQVVIRVVP
jgi:eukaryotic-like serine/threonine-protein kinase